MCRTLKIFIASTKKDPLKKRGGPEVLPKKGARDTPMVTSLVPLLLLLLHLRDFGAALLAGAVGALAVSARALPLLLTCAT